MVKPITQKFEELVLELSTDGGTTWARICGLSDATVTRTANIDTDEVPADCDDESLPHDVSKAVRSLDVSVSATGKWAQQSHGTIMDWFYSGGTQDVRIGNLNAAVGETEYETGLALLANLSSSRTKGQSVSAEIDVQFVGIPSRTAKA